MRFRLWVVILEVLKQFDSFLHFSLLFLISLELAKVLISHHLKIIFLSKRAIVILLLINFFQQLDSFLCSCPHRLILVGSADVKNMQNLIFVFQDILAKMGTNRVNSINGHSFSIWVLGFLNLVKKERHEFVIVKFEVFLDVKNYGNHALKELLVRLKLFHSEDDNQLISNFIQPLVQNIIRAIYYYFGQTCYGSALNNFVRWFFKHRQRHFHELIFENFLLLMRVFNFVDNVPDKLPNCLTYRHMQLNCSIFLYFLRKIGQQLRNKWHKWLLKYLWGYPKHFVMLFYLWQLHMLVDVWQAVEKYVHSVIIQDILDHELF